MSKEFNKLLKLPLKKLAKETSRAVQRYTDKHFSEELKRGKNINESEEKRTKEEKKTIEEKIGRDAHDIVLFSIEGKKFRYDGAEDSNLPYEHIYEIKNINTAAEKIVGHLAFIKEDGFL